MTETYTVFSRNPWRKVGKVYWINADNDQPYLFRDRESGALSGGY